MSCSRTWCPHKVTKMVMVMVMVTAACVVDKLFHPEPILTLMSNAKHRFVMVETRHDGHTGIRQSEGHGH